MFNTTVDKILSSFTKNIEQLERLATQKNTESDEYNVIAEEATLNAGKALLESRRADIVAGKIRTLIGG